MKKLELVKALKDSLSLEKKIKNKIKNLEKTIKDNKKLKEKSDKEFLINAKNFFKTRAYSYKAHSVWRGDYIDHHVIIGGFLYTFYGVDKESKKILLESGNLKYFSQKIKRHTISLSLDEFLEKTDPVMKSIREKDSFKKGDDVFLKDNKLFMGYEDSGKAFIINKRGVSANEDDNCYRGKILRILENNTAIVLLLFPGWALTRLEVLVDLKQLRHTTLIDDIYNRIKKDNFEISEMGGFKIGDQICYKNNKTSKYEYGGKFYYDILDYNKTCSHTFNILGFINDKVIVGAYQYKTEDYTQLFIVNGIEEIEKL